MEKEMRRLQEVEKIRAEQEYYDYTARKAAEQRLLED